MLGTKGAEVRETGLFKKLKKFMLNARVEKYHYRLGGPWLTQLVEHATLDLRVLSLSPVCGIEFT